MQGGVLLCSALHEVLRDNDGSPPRAKCILMSGFLLPGKVWARVCVSDGNRDVCAMFVDALSQALLSEYRRDGVRPGDRARIVGDAGALLGTAMRGFAAWDFVENRAPAGHIPR